MIGGLFLASYGLGTGGAVGNLLFDLEQMGVFAYVLPFLMIFALVYAILSKVQLLGSNNSVNIILALTTALMALQFNFVSYFFSEIFPRMGVLLSLIIVAVILMGLFFDFEEDGIVKKVMGAIVGLGFIVIVVQSFDWFGGGYFFGWGGNLWYTLQSHLYWFLPLALGVIVVTAVIKGQSGESEEEKAIKKLKKIQDKKKNK
jgi:hypothetical protein